jgi:molecular chaperone HtpG
MSGPAQERIAFDVETSRILKILSSEIYDSPKAFLRENVQNAYDAILMRCTEQGLTLTERRIDITVEGRRLTVRDDGIGMTEDVLRNSFWKAGASGKKSELAQRSGVIGTFGIGAMANFGVCSAIRVQTRHVASEVTLISSAVRENLRIGQECIDLDRSTDAHPVGTTLTAELDEAHGIAQAEIEQYLNPYVRFLPVPVFVNGKLISQTSFEKTLGGRAAGFASRSRRQVAAGQLSGTLETFLNPQARLLARLTDITLGGQPIAGELFLVQDGGQTLGFRNLFGLAPVPISSTYSLGGFVNLAILHPTAGREALSRESIQHVAGLVAMIEAEASHDIAATVAADHNQNFQQYILNNGLTRLAHNVTITVLPSRSDVALGALPSFELTKTKLFYTGREATVLQRFATEQNNLLHLSQANPRRKLQMRYLQTILKIDQAPETTIVERIPATQLTIEEAMCLVRIRGVLRDDYWLPEVDLAFANISHGVAFHVEKTDQALSVSIARDMPAVKLPIEAYRSAQDVFDGFVKDFVREHLYSHIRDHVPSSTRQGRDALYKRLKENKELFRYEEDEFGEIESLLAEYLSGKADLDHVLRASAGRVSTQRQEVSREQVGTVEEEIPDIIGTVEAPEPRSELEAAPPLLRTDIVTPMKVLTVGAPHPKLNQFQMFLALSDRAVRTEGEFFRWPHTTRLIWGAHRVIYIFTDATGGLSLYYDIELREPLATSATGGAMFPTTTIITKDRIYVPVPKELEPAFQITAGAKEFYVRFDTIP